MINKFCHSNINDIIDTQNLFCENQAINSATVYSENIIAFGKEYGYSFKTITNDKYGLSQTLGVKTEQDFNNIHYVTVLGDKK